MRVACALLRAPRCCRGGSPPSARPEVDMSAPRPITPTRRISPSLFLALTLLAAACDTAEADPAASGAMLAADAGSMRSIEIALGERSARSRGCTGCHDAGDGIPAGRIEALPGTAAFPPNLTPDFDTGIGAWGDEQIARAIREGVDRAGDPLCAVMPRYPK